jgi:REP element-mobilizing transposase RayT
MNRAPTLGDVVRAFKARASRAVGAPIWQRNYYEHIIRNERAHQAIRDYISNNPANWPADQLHPNAPANQFNREW